MENETLDLEQEAPKQQKYTTIGGWLIIPVIGLIFTPIAMIIGIVNDLLPAVTEESLAVFKDPASEFYNPVLPYILYGEIAVNLAFAIFAIVVLIYFFRFKSQTPVLYISFLASNLLFLVIDGLLILMLGFENEDGFFTRDILQLIVGCCIWIPYFLMSERVKGTFVK